MGDLLTKVQSGDPLRIPAATFNTFIDAAEKAETTAGQKEQRKQ